MRYINRLFTYFTYLPPMGKNRPDHLLQDTQSVKTHAAVLGLMAYVTPPTAKS